jgi:hypothetical protein
MRKGVIFHQRAVDYKMGSTALCGNQTKGSTVRPVRNMTVRLVMVIVLLISSILTACGTSTSHLLSSDEIARLVGAHYGEAHPQITGVKSTEADPPPHDPMYLMTISGHFKKGALEADTLSFSALASRMYVWNITAHDQAGNEVWIDRELGSAAPAPSPSS